MLYLLDADTLIRADSTYYPLSRFPIFWVWLGHHGQLHNIKIPVEQYEEIVAGNGELVDWLQDADTASAMILN
jgi:hypothetical protein